MSCFSSFSVSHVSVVVLKVTFDIGLHGMGGRTYGWSRDCAVVEMLDGAIRCI